MKIVKCRWIPRRYCVNLFGTLWVRDPRWIDSHVINHERIHTAQQRELLFIPFYIIYLLEFLIKFLIYRSREKSYYAISFEREAYTHGHNLSYLPTRKPFAWLNYLKCTNKR